MSRFRVRLARPRLRRAAGPPPRVERGTQHQWSYRHAICLVLAAAFGVVIATPTSSDAASPPVPFVDCVTSLGGNAVAVYFGYSNTSASSIDIPVGANNLVDPGTPFQGQPETFNQGTYNRVFRSVFDSTLFPGATWTLNGQTVFGSLGTSPACQAGVTAPASGLTTSSATLNGAVDPAGEDTTWHFDYGAAAPAYGQSTATQTASGTQVQLVQAALGSLQPSTTYHFRLDTSNGTATSDGADQSFTTPTVASSAPGSLPAFGVGPSGVVPNFTG
jgi:hypothetical protein